ncbi:MAG: Ig-like domain-containing domain [Pelobium sp.]
MKIRQFNLLLFTVLLFAACASLQTPQGGPRDITPPKVLEEFPKNLSTNFTGDKILITFDEYFKLNSEYTEISVSPAQDIPPIFKIRQKSLEINFKDSLQTNTTYTINFGKAIQDVNEANTLKNYSFVFSTGPKLDSLQISGQVVSSSDNKPVLDATVFIFQIERDSLFGKKKPSFYTNTDSSGNFSLKNLRESEYTIYALKETGVDRIYNSPNEEIAFSNSSIKLNKDTSQIILKLFKEVPERFRIVDRKIESDGRISMYFNKGLKNPSLTFIDAPSLKNPIVDFSLKGDTALVWLPEINFDSLKIAINSDNKALDTVTFKRGKKDSYDRTILFSNNLSGGKIKPGSSLILTFNLPVASINPANAALLEDSVSKSNFTFTKIANSERKYQVNFPWKIKKRYSLGFKEGAITDIYGTPNKQLKLDFELDETENYGNLSIKFSKEDSLKNYVVQLLTEKNAVYSEFPVTKTMTKIFNNIPTNKFTVKVIEDANSNGEYDTGNVRLKIQPEKSWFWDKEIVTRANWDREEVIVIPKGFY